MSMPKISYSAAPSVNLEKGNLAENFGRLTPELILTFLFKLNSHNEVRKCLCTHRIFEPIDKNFWPSLLNQYFPFSYKKYGLTQYGKLQFAYLSRIDNHIRGAKCFYKETEIVLEFFRSDPFTLLRLDHALKFSNEKLFHTGFGDYGAPSQDNTTIDVHDVGSSALNLDKRIGSIRIPRKDIICTYVHGNDVYLGTSNGGLLCVNPMQSHTQTLIEGVGRSIPCIQFYQGFVYCIASTDNNHSLLIYEVQSKEVNTLELKSKIVGLQIYEENLYCIAENGDIEVLDLKKRNIYRNNLKNREFVKKAPQIFDSERVTIAEGQGTSENQKVGVRPTQPKTDSSGCFGITGQVKLNVTVHSSPLIIEGFLYVFSDELSVWEIKNIKEMRLSYTYGHEKYKISAVTAHREYVFVGIHDGSIQVLQRKTGQFISTIYPPSESLCSIHGLIIDRDTLYAYTMLGEIVVIKLDESFFSGFTQGAAKAFRIIRHSDFNFSSFNLSRGPNRLWF